MLYSFVRAIVCIVCIFAFNNIYAQDIPVMEDDAGIITTDSSSLQPLVSKIDSFYQKYTISLKACDNPELYNEIFRWYRTCYRYGGNSSKGIDCSHFVNMLYEKIYGKKLNSSAASIFAQCKVVKGKKEEYAEGDLLFFKIKKKRISHIGIYLQHGKFAHATTQAGVIISDLSEAYYKRRFFKAGRVE